MGAFETDKPLVLRRHPNGGWTIQSQVFGAGFAPEALGAYSTAEDMLTALQRALTSNP